MKVIKLVAIGVLIVTSYNCKEVKKEVRASIKAAWSAFNASIQFNLNKAQDLLGQVANESSQGAAVAALKEKIAK